LTAERKLGKVEPRIDSVFNEFEEGKEMTNESNETEGMTRRQLITTAVVGGAAVVVGAVGGAAVGNSIARPDYELELARLRTLVGLYEQLEKIGIDAIIGAGMSAVRGALDAVRAGLKLLRDGITATESALKNFQTTLESLRSAMNGANLILNDLSGKLRAAETVVTSALGTAAAPIAETIGKFFTDLIKKIPLGIGDEILRAINSLTDLIRAVPTTVDSLSKQLLKPMTDLLFPATGVAPVQTNLFDPITKNLLEPLKKMLGDLDTLIAKWETDFTTPVQKALNDRAQIRKQIAEYRTTYNV
jgi:hypothetical protein